MKAELKAVYNASLVTQSHAVFYRLPNQKSILGKVAFNLAVPETLEEGFLIGAFDSKKPYKLIPEEISFKCDPDFSYSIAVKNKFTTAFQEEYDNYLSSISNEPFSFYLPDDIHEASRTEYMEKVNQAIFAIYQKQLTKVVLSRVAKQKYTKEKHPLALFYLLAEKYPNAFISLISSPEYGTWIGASPETLLHQQQNRFSTMAVAGTKRSEIAGAFRSKEKEEQKIIEDYIEEILSSKNIETETSSVSNYDVGGLMHLKTNIKFTTAATDGFEIAKLLHPTPAVGGFPKKEALEFISSHEKYDRGLYAGFLGPVKRHELNLFVNIRCMQWGPEYAILYAGAGITKDSVAEEEWEETENKLQVIGSVL